MSTTNPSKLAVMQWGAWPHLGPFLSHVFLELSVISYGFHHQWSFLGYPRDGLVLDFVLDHVI